MSQSSQEQKNHSKMVFIVTCYGNIQGVFANGEDAFKAQMDLINKNCAAELVSRVILDSYNFYS